MTPFGSNFFNNELVQVVLLTILMAILAVFSARQAAIARSIALSRQPPKIYVVESCGETEFKREYKEGDYVGKVVGKCEDGEIKVIKAIYVEEVKQPNREKGRRTFRI